jgi:hypothetical protein
MKERNEICQGTMQRGSALFEMLCTLPIFIFLFGAILEVARLLCFKAMLYTTAWELATALASKYLMLEERHLLQENSPWNNDVTPNLSKFLEDETATFLGETPGARLSLHQKRPLFLERLDFHLYVQHLGTRTESGFQTTIVACLPYLSISFFDSRTEARRGRDCLGQFQTEASGPAFELGASAFRLRAQAFAPHHASREIFHHGFAVPKRFLGVDKERFPNIPRFEAEAPEPSGTMRWYKNRRNELEEAERNWLASNRSERGSVLVGTIALFVAAALGALFVLSKMERAHNISYCASQARTAALAEANKKATQLNEMAMSNALMMEALSTSIDAWHKFLVARELAMVTIPFWVERGEGLQENEDAIKPLREALQQRASRGFLLAEGLTQRENKLSVELADTVRLTQKSPDKTFCFVFASLEKKSGMLQTATQLIGLATLVDIDTILAHEGCRARLSGFNQFNFQPLFDSTVGRPPRFGIFLLEQSTIQTWKLPPYRCRADKEQSFLRAHLFRLLSSFFGIEREQIWQSRFSVSINHPLLKSSPLGAMLTPHWVGLIASQEEN